MKRLLLAIAVLLCVSGSAFAQQVIPWVAATNSYVVVQNPNDTTVYVSVYFSGCSNAYVNYPLSNFNSAWFPVPCSGYAVVYPDQIGATPVYTVGWVQGTYIYTAGGSSSLNFSGSGNNNGLAIANNSGSNRSVTIDIYDGSMSFLFSNSFTINAYSATGLMMYEWFPPATYGDLPGTYYATVSASGWSFGGVATDCSGSPCTVIAAN